MLIHVYGIPDSVSFEEQKKLRDRIQDSTAEILNITELVKPIFVDTIPSRFSDSAGLFAQIHINTKEADAQTKRDLIEQKVCTILREFATVKVQSTWMVGAFSTVQDFHLSELEF